MTHHPLCEYWFDQYPWECSCGLTKPKAAWFDAYVAESPKPGAATAGSGNDIALPLQAHKNQE